MKLEDSSLGLLETRGLTGAIVAADAMLKAANVNVFQHHLPGSGRVTVMCMGQLAACAAAMEAGAAAAMQVGELLGRNVIARPEGGAIGVCRALSGGERADKAAPAAKTGKKAKPHA